MLVVAGIFIAFALLSAMVIPRYRPKYPGRGLGLFIVACVLLFAAMITAVLVFGAESESESLRAAATALIHTL